MPAPSSPDRQAVADATSTLVEVTEYLRGSPPVAESLPLLGLLLDEDTGVPILLSDILRDAARLVSEQADRPATEEIRNIVDGLRHAAQEATDWHVLHWDIPRLRRHFAATAAAQGEA
ncbi:hypothetical protein ACWEL8_09700 [Streptomyces sp. NPDC004690]